MLPLSFSFLSQMALFLGVFLISFLDTGDTADSDEVDFYGTEGDDDFDDPLIKEFDEDDEDEDEDNDKADKKADT